MHSFFRHFSRHVGSTPFGVDPAARHAMRHGAHGGAGSHGGRHGHHRGGPFGEGPGGRGFGHPFAGRKLASADLQLLILALLDEQPRHGYELIKAFEERSGGVYVPSPGMVYPALSYIEEAGLGAVEVDGNKKRYALTDAGREALAARRAEVDAMLQQPAQFAEQASRTDGLGDAMPGRGLGGIGGRGRHGADDPVHAALHTLRQALSTALRSATSPDEQGRIAGILDRAAEELGRR